MDEDDLQNLGRDYQKRPKQVDKGLTRDVWRWRWWWCINECVIRGYARV